jgi:hypothetical protein
MAAGAASIEHDRLIAETEPGRRSLELRALASKLRQQGRDEDAHAAITRMARLFTEDDDGPAAAAARHDLADSFFIREVGVPVENLDTAIALAERALRSPARARVDQRRIQTERLLASCLRKRAKWLVPEEASRHLARAEGLLRAALAVAERIGPFGLVEVVRSATNLANLRRDVGDLDGAIELHERAVSASEADALRNEPADDRARTLLNCASARASRGRPADRNRADELLSRVAKMAVRRLSSEARLHLAHSYLERGKRARAERLVGEVLWEELAETSIVELAAPLLLRLGDPLYARSLLQKVMDDSIRRRSQTIADHAAAWAVKEGQSAAAAAARIDVAGGHALRGFLALENLSGLLFGESLRRTFWTPADGLEAACQDRMGAQAATSGFLEQFLAVARGLPATEWAPMVATLRAQTPGGGPFKEACDIVLRAAVAEAPVAALERAYDEARREAIGAREILLERSAAFREAERLVSAEVDEAAVLGVLQERPETTLLRLSIAGEELLAIGVWLEGDRLATGHGSYSIPHDLKAHIAGHGPPDAALLERLDLSPALPEKLRDVVLFPSVKALSLPLIALGPRGRRLVDRARSVSWLASLVPLRGRQVASTPRSGHVVAVGPQTHFDALAFDGPNKGETVLRGAAATAEALLAAARGADVVSLYAHGSWVEAPAIHLAAGPLGQRHLDETWHGIERVELFACESAEARPMDPRALPTDDGLGLDFELLRVGARSAIGALWPVPELSTAAICRRYRALTREGRPAPEALLSAQRWWIEEGHATLARHLDADARTGVRDFCAAFASATLGPETLADRRTSGETLLRELALPTAWAGLRFVGVHEVRPLARAVEPPSASAQDHAELDRLLSTQDEAPSPEARLDAIVMTSHASVPPALALEVASLYRFRAVSSHEHNLLFALAWLHEALSDTRGEARDPLLLEAARTWMELATAHAGSALELRLLQPAEPVYVARARRLLESPGLRERQAAEVEALEALARTLADPSEECARKAWKAWNPPIESMTTASLTIACEVATLVGDRELAGRVLDASRAHLQATAHLAGGAETRLAARACALSQTADGEPLVLPFAGLAPRDAEAVLRARIRRFDLSNPRHAEEHLRVVGEALSTSEQALHGYPSDDRSEIVTTTGTHGPPYFRMLTAYLTGQARTPTAALHVLACLELASDQWIALGHKLSQHAAMTEGSPENPFRSLALCQVAVDDAVQALVDQSRLPAPEGAPGAPHRLDPFTMTPEALAAGATEDLDRTAWVIGDASVRLDAKSEGRTAAFQLVRAAERRRRVDGQIWRTLGEAVESEAPKTDRGAELFASLRALAPSLRLEEIEERLRTYATRAGFLGLLMDSLGNLVLAAAYPGQSGPVLATEVIEPSALVGLVPLLFESALNGDSSQRRETWSRIVDALAPRLDRLMPPPGAPPVDWVVLAPGALRGLPVLGLRVGTRPMHDVARSVSLVPSLAFLDSISYALGTPGLACLHVPSAVEPATSHVLRQLRALQPPAHVLDPVDPPGMDIVERDHLAALRGRFTSVRIVSDGLALHTRTTTSVLLEGRRAMRVARVPTPLACRTVAFWGCASGVGEFRAAQGHEGDVLPELVRQFLTAGAQGVIDLAWPVHDLLRAFVLELYTGAALRLGEGPAALAHAVRAAAGCADMWIREARRQGTVAGALEALDAVRLTLARSAGLVTPANEAHFRPLAPLAPSLGVTVDELIEALTDPSALASFRYWGI